VARQPSIDQLIFRQLLPSDDIDLITSMLHEAYAPLADAGMRFVASHQGSETTRGRLSQGETFVAVDGNMIVGIVTLADANHTRGTAFLDRPDVADFGQLAVRPPYQGCGIGSQLIAMVEERARAKGLTELALNTSEHASHLIAMYTKKGFRFVEYVTWPDVNYRSMVFSKRLK
jgi:GNAT superfamily N-acetyltransferase